MTNPFTPSTYCFNMKLKPKKKLPATIRAKDPRATLRKKFDETVDAYHASKAREDLASASVNITKTQITEIVQSKDAVETEKGREFVGDRFVGRITRIMASPVVDVAMLKKLYPKLAKKVIKTETVESVDEDELAACIEHKEIKAADVAKIVTTPVRGERFSVTNRE